MILEVRQARLDYEQSRTTVDRFRNEIIPNAKTIRDERFRQFTAGEGSSVDDYFKAQDKYDHTISRIATAIRQRRSMLALNTAVGERIMP